MNRFGMLVQLALRWPGPIVAAVTHEPDATPPEVPPAVAHRITLLLRERERDAPFPINALRNAAIAAVTTSHFLLLDVDLWPSANLLEELMHLDASWWMDTPQIALLYAPKEARAQKP